MPWKKPYHPSRNQRLPETLYADPDQVCFITLRAYAGQRPFVTPELNARIVKTLFDAQDASAASVYLYCSDARPSALPCPAAILEAAS